VVSLVLHPDAYEGVAGRHEGERADRGVLQDVPVDGLGTLKLFGLTALFEKGHGSITTPPPRLGEHTAAVLASIGIDAEKMAALKQSGVV
jgi:formyl-CoA transferase